MILGGAISQLESVPIPVVQRCSKVTLEDIAFIRYRKKKKKLKCLYFIKKIFNKFLEHTVAQDEALK